MTELRTHNNGYVVWDYLIETGYTSQECKTTQGNHSNKKGVPKIMGLMAVGREFWYLAKM